jgi:hypothetical protein
MDPTLEAFCDRFAQGAGAAGQWTLVASFFATGQRLLRWGAQCPLSAQGHATSREDVTAGSARERLAEANGLTLPQAAAIEDASDDEPGHDPVLRTRLLAAAGLAEEHA